MSENLFIQLVYKSNYKDLFKLLTTTNIDMHKCKDSRGMTALHIASLNGNTSLTRFLIEFSKKKHNSPSLLESWVNFPSEEGFTAIHFAAFRGYIVKFI